MDKESIRKEERRREEIGLAIVQSLPQDMQNVILALLYEIHRTEWRRRIIKIHEEYRSFWDGFGLLSMSTEDVEYSYLVHFGGKAPDEFDYDYDGRRINYRGLASYQFGLYADENSTERSIGNFNHLSIVAQVSPTIRHRIAVWLR